MIVEAFEHAWAVVIVVVGLGLASLGAIVWVALRER